MMQRTKFFLEYFIIPLLALSLLSCKGPIPEQPKMRLRLATTTSTQDSGLLDVLLPPFDSRCNVKVDVIAVGTGKAMKLGENGDVDVILAHAPAAEERFVSEGFGVNRRQVMYNDFVIVGSRDDPAGIRGNDSIKAMGNIANASSHFVSRGDESGTHKKEKQLWAQTGLKPQGDWYLETGQGMGATFMLADEKRAYCLVDRGTYIALENRIDLVILCEGDPRFLNPYSIIAIHPGKHPHVHYVNAMALIGWVTSPEGQRIIGEFKKEGKALFHPSAYSLTLP